MRAVFSAPNGIGGELIPPADKSITHRALMLGAVSGGVCRVSNPLATGDCLSTAGCLRSLGVSISEEREGEKRILRIEGIGIRGFREPQDVLDAGNSGTTMRLLAGLLAGLPIYAVMSGDHSLLSRPMLRIVDPLQAMGAQVFGRNYGRYAPLVFLPGNGTLRALRYELGVPSAQVKSALLFAALRSTETSVLTGKLDSRDHTERLFAYLKLPLEIENERLALKPVSGIPPFDIEIPGDISSAAFFITAALISGRELWVHNCGINPTRMGFIEIVRKMGAGIEVVEEALAGNEPVGSIHVKPGTLKGVSLSGSQIGSSIDEVPLLAVLGVFARGFTKVCGAGELRTKESDRIDAVAGLITALGGVIRVYEDGFSIEGPQSLSKGAVYSGNDHRIAMAGAVLSAGIKGEIEVRGFEAASVSYPNFIDDFKDLGGNVE